MMNFKNREGFSLLEVMIAVAVASIMLMPVFNLQTNVLMRITRQTRKLEAIFLAEQFKAEAQREIQKDVRQFTKEKMVEDTKLMYTLSPVGDSSVKQFPGMLQETVQAVWKSGRDQVKQQIISYVYKPEVAKKE